MKKIELEKQVKEHWQKRLPSLYDRLQEERKLDEEAKAAVQRTFEALETGVSSGGDPTLLWEALSRDWLFPEPENTQARG